MTYPHEELNPEQQPSLVDSQNPLFRELSHAEQENFRRFDIARAQMQAEIAGLSIQGMLLGAHGTSSNYLESILVKGLGADTPVGALAKSKSITDATMKDGMLGAYLFAKGQKGNMLAINREQIDPSGDILTRYTILSPAIPERALRSQLERYFSMRAAQVGASYKDAYPVLLVVGTDEPSQMWKMNPAVPSEMEFGEPFTHDQFKMIRVPEAKIDHAQHIISQSGLSIVAEAIEPLELF